MLCGLVSCIVHRWCVALCTHVHSLCVLPIVSLTQERIEPAKPAREHVTPYTHNVNGEIQTWRTLTIYSSYQIWSEMHKFNRPRAQAFDTHSDRSMTCLPFDSSKLAGVVSCT